MRHETLVGGGAFIVLRNVGQLLVYIAALPLLLLPVALYYGEHDAILPALAMAFAFLASGYVLKLLPARREPRLREGLLVAAVGWLLVPAGSVVLFVLLEDWRLLDAYFESMSAWTGTGMSVADLLALHKTTLFWRSLMQWVGGLGVIVLTLAILARPGTGAHTLYVGEAREDKLRPSVLSTVRLLWRIYILLTVASVLLLVAAGLSPWDALNHGLTAIATGGMSTYPESIGAFTSPLQQLAFVPIMIVGSFPFIATYALFRGRWAAFLRDEQVQALVVVALLTVLFLAWRLDTDGLFAERGARWVAAVFQGVSAATTTGFQTVPLADWYPAAKVGLVGVMLLGAAAGSTAGGIKLYRGVLLLKGALWKLNRSGLPHFAVTSFEFGGERLDEREANEEFAEASFILVLWVALAFVGFLTLLIILPPGHEVVDVLFDVASAQGNSGLSTGVVSIAMPDVAKGAFILIMWAGRLEILPVLLLLRGLVPRRG